MTDALSSAAFDALAAALAPPRDGAELRRLLTRIAASPPTFPANAWHRLIAGADAPGIAERLDALVAGLRPAPPVADPTRLERLRETLRSMALDGFILPRADEHQGEFIPAPAQRLAWLTGFTGSAGIALVLRDTATLFVDGRYSLQAARQTDGTGWSVAHVLTTPPDAHLRAHLAGGTLGYDPKLHSVTVTAGLKAAVEAGGGRLVACEPNPIDGLWSARPAAPLGPVELLAAALSGLGAAEKRARIAAELRQRGVDATVLNQPESIAWLLNIRGCDIPYTPLALAYARLSASGEVELFLDAAKCDAGTRAALEDQVTLRPFEAVAEALGELGREGARVSLDPDTASDWLDRALRDAGAAVTAAPDPCVLPRARKNASELAGTRAAHARDATAIARFLHWLDSEAGSGTVTELSAAATLEGFRSELEHWRGPSFPSISGAGPNAAIVHYRVTPQSDRPLEADSLYLIDSGAQYLDGTTDITRTIAIATASSEMRARFTLVLKGHIAIATARFPAGTTGGQLDALARQFLWRAGLDFDHGTGHGVGVFLGVHEGPQRLSSQNRVPIEAGMILSNEPGYYKPDGYGIRIENLVVAVEAGAMADSGHPMLAFETISFAPIDRRLVEPALMTADELAWLDRYHAEVRRRVEPGLDEAVAAWLRAATAPIAGTGARADGEPG